MRADLVALGVRLGWVAADEKEEPALAAVRERLRDEGEGLLLIYDNAIDAASVRPYLPLGGAARVLVTRMRPPGAPSPTPVEIELAEGRRGRLSDRPHRPRERAGRGRSACRKRSAACRSRTNRRRPIVSDLEISLADYRRRFEAAPAELLDAEKDAPEDYHNKLTAAKAFALAIDEATKLHPAAEPLIVHAALLAPEPIPLFLFAEAREKFGEPLASLLAGDGLDEAIGALLAFALVDRETIPDERDPRSRPKRYGCTGWCGPWRRIACKATPPRRRGGCLIEAMSAVYPGGVFGNPAAWPRARRLDALALDLVVGVADGFTRFERPAAHVMDRLALYRRGPLAAYSKRGRFTSAPWPFGEGAWPTIRHRRELEQPRWLCQGAGEGFDLRGRAGALRARR